mgnify:CR=1 FL=1
MAGDGTQIGPRKDGFAGKVAPGSGPLHPFVEAKGASNGPLGPLGPPSQHIPPADEESGDGQSQLPWDDFAEREGIGADDPS